MANKYSNLIELLLAKSGDNSRLPAFTFLGEDGQVQESWTYAELARRACAIAAQLQRAGCQGRTVLLLYGAGLDFIAAFWGCILAGAIAVPAYPPRSNRNALRLKSIVQDSQAKAILTTGQLLARIQALVKDDPAFSAFHYLVTDDGSGDAEQWKQPDISGSSIAFLQYTSGSTAAPKGVVVSHSNLLHNEARIQETFRQTAKSIIVGWLPLYHDMGLIGNVLQPLYLGSHCILMSPVTFLQQPMRWLEAISRYRATTSGGPNFAYDLCARKISDEQLDTLELSCWEVAFNGAEPIRPETLENFSRRFTKAGFRPQAFFPCYGLAEATLLVSGKPGPMATVAMDVDALSRGHVQIAPADSPAKQIVSCGGTSSDSVVIVDPVSRALCPPDQIGEIWVSGSSVAQGYWNRKESEAVFQARTADDRGPFLRTGDLGFLRGGELFVSGRLKDMIIIRGRNHYPQDIEATVEAAHDGLRAGCGAAFAIDSDSAEKLVIVQEVEHGREGRVDDAISAIRGAVAEQHDIHPHAVALVRSGSIPKTSSGKIQRHACRQGFLAGDLKTIALWHSEAPAENVFTFFDSMPSSGEEVEQWLIRKLAVKAGLPPDGIHLNDPVSRYGLDSLAAIELAHEIERELGRVVHSTKMLDGLSVIDLANEIAQSPRRTSANASGHSDGRNTQAEEFELSEGQKALWFLYELAPESIAYNLRFAACIHNCLDTAGLHKVLARLVERHPSLRTTFHSGAGAPFQLVNPSSPKFFREVDVSAMDEQSLQRELEEQASLPFDLRNGPVFRAVVFRRSRSEIVLLLVMHHIIADLWSLALLLHEFTLLHAAEKTGSVLALPPAAFSYRNYVCRQRERNAHGGEKLDQYWKNQLSGALPELDLPTDHPRPSIQSYQGASQAFKFDAELSREIKALSQRTGTTLYTLLLAVFQLLLHGRSGQKDVLVGSPTSGRERAEWAGVVGYFVNPVVIRTRLSAGANFSDFLRQVRTTVLQALQHQDYPFFRLVEQLQPERDPSRSPIFQAMFALEKTAFLEKEGISALAVESHKKAVQFNGVSLEPVPLKVKAALFDLMLLIAEDRDCLCGSVQYNTDLFEPKTIEKLIQRYVTLLRQVVKNPAMDVQELMLEDESERLRRKHAAGTQARPLGSLTSKKENASQADDFVPDDAGELPRSPVEELLCDIFAAVLSKKRVGRNDDFFDLGGHSLLAMQIMSRIESSFSLKLPLRTLFESPTPAELAERVEESVKHQQRAEVPPMLPVPRTAPIPLSFAQQRLWLLDQLEPGTYFYNSGAAVRLRGRLNIEAISRSFSEITARHEVLRTTFPVENGVPVQAIAPAQPLTVPLLDLFGAPNPSEAALEVTRREAELPFDLGHAPLLRALLVRLSAEDHLLLVTMHHIISDAWSIKILIREFTALYRAFTLGEAPELPELPVQYADFSCWQRNWMQGEVLEKYIDHWRRNLAGLSALQLRVGKGASDFRGGRGRNDWYELPAPAVETLKELGRQKGATLFTTMLAVFQVLLLRYSGQEDFAVGIHLAGRNHTEVEDLIGFFVNMMPLRADLSGDPTFEELLDRARAATLDAYAYQDLPFDKLVQEIKPPRVNGRPQMFQVAFAMQNEAITLEHLPDLEAEVIDSGEDTVRLGLVLWIMATPRGLKSCWRYNTSVFLPAEIGQLNKDFGALLEAIAMRPDARLSELGPEPSLQSKPNDVEEETVPTRSTGVSFQVRKRNPVQVR
jgi:acyl-CoA synthetase (AMP-forming)/AMP-acid ligase II/acyl carrier protein